MPNEAQHYDRIGIESAAGDLHARFFEALVDYRRLPRQGRIERAHGVIDQLREVRVDDASDSPLISEPEVAMLHQVYDHVGNVEATDPQIAESVRSLAQSALDTGVSPVVEVILRIAMDSTARESRLAEQQGRADETGDGPIAHADVETAIVGAILGTEFAVPAAPKTAGLSLVGGAVWGGLIGGVAGSVAQAI
ncbi:hypothetical protein CLV35_0347 [Motilibacter peucedani]|uniref:Uncharacterized protein n=2 Tax=Motilibacter peucedani TaxID=598650 RepID=A0A420XT47_9ACTN|nr:hypothetical protein CLV35_0347 [Motilibacter peucedani]